MITYSITGFDGTIREVSQEECFKIMKEQTFGAIVGCALEDWTKEAMQDDFEYDNIEEVDEKIKETIGWVLSIKNYQYRNKYKPYLIANKEQALEKLFKLLKGAMI